MKDLSQLTVRETAEVDDSWLEAQLMHERRANMIDIKELFHTAPADARNKNRTARYRRTKIQSWP